MMPFLNRSYRVIAYRIFTRSRIIETFFPKKYRTDLKPALKKAGLHITPEEYLSSMLLTCVLSVPFFFLAFNFLFLHVIQLAPSAAFLMSMLFSFISTGSVVVFFLVYPSYAKDNLKRNIEVNLPYAVTHMATVAGTGVPIQLVFKLMGNFEEYGEVAKECRRIARNIEVFGYDVTTALAEAAGKTPSPSFKDLLWGIVTIIRSGGDLRQYLVGKAKELMEKRRIVESQYLDTLSLMAEIYITLFVAGPILFVIMVTVMGSMTNIGIPMNVLFAIFVYILIPVMAAGFMFMIEGSKPVGM